jgi:hypothetical protein
LAHIVRELVIDAGDADLSDVYKVVVMPGGSLAVLEWEDRAIRFFDAHGTATGAFGRNGEGPGEFRCVCEAGIHGDTLWVDDLSLRRVTFVAPDHRLARSRPATSSVTAPSSGEVWTPPFGMRLQAINPDGTQLVEFLDLGPSPRPFWAPAGLDIAAADAPWVRLTEAGTFQQLISWPTDRDHCIVTLGPGQRNFAGIPFCSARYDAVSQDGSAIAHVAPALPSAGEPQFHLSLVNAYGTVLYDRNYRYRPITVPLPVADSVKASHQASKNAVIAAAWESGKLSVPRLYPAAKGVIVGRDHTIWLQLWTNMAYHDWLVLDPHGNPISHVIVPAAIEVKVAERGHFWGVATDKDGLPSIVRYSVTVR